MYKARARDCFGGHVSVHKAKARDCFGMVEYATRLHLGVPVFLLLSMSRFPTTETNLHFIHITEQEAIARKPSPSSNARTFY